jgi:hypothetical protein
MNELPRRLAFDQPVIISGGGPTRETSVSAPSPPVMTAGLLVEAGR